MSAIKLTPNPAGTGDFNIMAPTTNNARTITLPDETSTLATHAYASNASNLVSGTVPTARLGSGTASSSTFLRGDQSWQAITMPSTSFDGVGSYVWALPVLTSDVGAGATIAGSNLRYNWAGGSALGFTKTTLGAFNNTYTAGGSSLSGTWRLMTSGSTYSTYSVESCGNITHYYSWHAGLYVRIS